ncbi:MAG: hypothetical protein ABI947_01645 [Chloroflexota bacterium]
MSLKIFKFLVACFICLTVCSTLNMTRAQESGAIRGPITALRFDGNRLLIGQGSTLVEAQVTDSAVQVLRTADLQRHDLWAFAVSQGITFALSEDGLTTFNAKGIELDFARGGGQRLVVKGSRVYIAAHAAGVRILKVEATGKLTWLGNLATAGSALDIVAESETTIWVAESDKGVRLYDTANPLHPTVTTWIGDLVPARVVRRNGTRLFVGQDKRISILDTRSLKAPRLLGTITVTEGAVADLLLAGNQIFVGRAEDSATKAVNKNPDVITFDISNLKTPTMVGTFGGNGAGEQLALHGNDLFIGSGRQGLRRVHFGASEPSLMATWEPLAAAPSCVLSAPTLPQPPNLAEVAEGPIELHWASMCPASSYELRINGVLTATLTEPTYTLNTNSKRITWQVTALDSGEKRVAGPTWIFDAALKGWLATPAAPPSKLVYVAPIVMLDFRSPGTVLATTCAALVIGLVIVVVGAWLIGSRSAQR